MLNSLVDQMKEVNMALIVDSKGGEKEMEDLYFQLEKNKHYL